MWWFVWRCAKILSSKFFAISLYLNFFLVSFPPLFFLNLEQMQKLTTMTSVLWSKIMNSPHVSHQESKSHHREDKFKKNVHSSPVHPLSGYAYLDYSYLLEFDLLRLMGVEMPPIHRNSYQLNRNEYWRDRHLNGMVIPPPPMVMPFFHSPNMVSNTHMKRSYWNNKDQRYFNSLKTILVEVSFFFFSPPTF